jgi:hypothetical protein
VRVWTGLFCFSKVSMVRSCEFRYEISGSIKLGNFSSNTKSQYYSTRLLKYMRSALEHNSGNQNITSNTYNVLARNCFNFFLY